MVTDLPAASSCFQGVNANLLLGFRQGFVCARNDSMKCSILRNFSFFFFQLVMLFSFSRVGRDRDGSVGLVQTVTRCKESHPAPFAQG